MTAEEGRHFSGQEFPINIPIIMIELQFIERKAWTFFQTK
jgi:hypothetical protein